MSHWHWYDSVIFFTVWSLPFVVIGMREYLNRERRGGQS